MRKTIQFRSSETDLTAKISSMIFDAAVKASTAKYVVVDSIAAEAQKLVGGLEAEVAQKDARIAELGGERDHALELLDAAVDDRQAYFDRIAELEEVLRPFAGLIPREWLENQFDDSKPVFAFSENVIRVGDFVKARAILEKMEEEVAP